MKISSRIHRNLVKFQTTTDKPTHLHNTQSLPISFCSFSWSGWRRAEGSQPTADASIHSHHNQPKLHWNGIGLESKRHWSECANNRKLTNLEIGVTPSREGSYSGVTTIRIGIGFRSDVDRKWNRALCPSKFGLMCRKCMILRATPSAAGPLCLLEIAIWGPWCILSDILGATLARRKHLGEPFCISEHLGRPFWHLGTTLEENGSSRIDTKLQITGFVSILKRFRNLFMSVFGVQNVLKFVLFLTLFTGHLFIDFWLEFSKSGT